MLPRKKIKTPKRWSRGSIALMVAATLLAVHVGVLTFLVGRTPPQVVGDYTAPWYGVTTKYYSIKENAAILADFGAVVVIRGLYRQGFRARDINIFLFYIMGSMQWFGIGFTLAWTLTPLLRPKKETPDRTIGE